MIRFLGYAVFLTVAMQSCLHEEHRVTLRNETGGEVAVTIDEEDHFVIKSHEEFHLADRKEYYPRLFRAIDARGNVLLNRQFTWRGLEDTGFTVRIVER